MPADITCLAFFFEVENLAVSTASIVASSLVGSDGPRSIFPCHVEPSQFQIRFFKEFWDPTC